MKSNPQTPRALAVAVAAAVMVTADDAAAKTLTIGVDGSQSNKVIAHENFAVRAAQYLRREITQLKTGDRVRLLTFGARGNVQNLIYREVVLSRRNRAEDVAKQVVSLVESLPESATQGQQSATNLIAWLEFTGDFGCGDEGRIVVLTDGLESSTLISGQELASGKPLPEPDVNLGGCHITFYGLGAGWQPHTVKTVRKAWETWSDQAGATFEAIIP